MKLAAPFALDNVKNDERIDEFNIVFKKSNSFEKLIDFLEMFPDKRVNIMFTDYSPTAYQFKMLNAAHENVYVVFSDIILLNDFSTVRQTDTKFYTINPINSWSELAYWTQQGVSEFYPAGDLLHEMDALRHYCQEHNLKTRMIVNCITGSINPVQDVFFRPQDFDLVDNYFDTVEFICNALPFDARQYNWNVFNVLYKAWFVKKHWIGALNQINSDVEFTLPCETIPDRFFSKKLNCGFMCMKGRKCNSCALYIEMAETLADKGVRIVSK